MWHDISIMIGTLIGWHAYGWLRSLHRWLDRKHLERQQRLWDERIDRAQEQTDKGYPR